MCVTSEVPVLKTALSNLDSPYFHPNGKRTVIHNTYRNSNSMREFQNKILPATNNVVDEISLSDDSFSDDDLEDFQSIESSSLVSSSNNKLIREESETQSNITLSESLYSNVIVPEQSSDLPIENELNDYSNQFTRPQAASISLMNEVCDQSFPAIENNQNMLIDHTTSLPGNTIIHNPTSLETRPIPNKSVAHSRTHNKNKLTRNLPSTFLIKLVQDLKDCIVEDEFGNL